MPFLSGLRREGLWLAAHYATSNQSHHALMSVMTGFYPWTSREEFVSLPGLRLPTMKDHWGGPLDSMVLTPCRSIYFFPRGLVLNEGFRLVDYDVIPAGELKDVSPLARHESVAMDFFMEELAGLKEPFWAIYFSYLGHFPYEDYGEAFRLYPADGPDLGRQMNQLHAMDHLIRRLWERVQAMGLAERTILVILGDHGEHFGEKGFTRHGVTSYEEAIAVPCLIYAPGRVVPGEVNEPTSHADLVPSLLDVAGREFNPAKFQGESLFRPLRRRYIFKYGGMDNLASIRYDGMKVILDFFNREIEVFDLASDPNETRPLAVEAAAEQVKATYRFGNYQTIKLRELSRKAREP